MEKISYFYDKFRAMSYAENKDLMTFSINIQHLVPTKGGEGVKLSGCDVRVSGDCWNKERVFARADKIVAALNNGTYTGAKNVKVKYL